MKRAVLFVQIVLAALIVMSAACRADPVFLSKAYWFDTSGAAAFDEAREEIYEPYDGTITRGFTSSALWLRLRVSGSEELKQYALVVKLPFLSKIELYDPLGYAPGDVIRPALSGRNEVITPDNHVGFDNGFIIAASPSPRDVFLRITTTTSLTADVSLLTLGKAERNVVVAGGVLATYFALLLGFCLWGFVNFWIRRDVIYAVFAARMLFSMAHLFVVTGLLRYVFSDQLGAMPRDLIYNLVLVTIIAVAGIFDIMVLRDFGAHHRLLKLLRALVYVPIISVGLVLLGYPQQALHITAVLVSVEVLFVLILAFTTRATAEDPYGRTALIIVRGGYLLLTLSVLVPTLILQSLIRGYAPLFNGIFLQAIISAVILSAMLSIRARQRDLLAQKAVLHLQLKERELKAESERRIEKERFLSMLTHELRNPLALIRLLTSTESANGRSVAKAAEEMAQVIEKVEQSDRIHDRALQVEIVPIAVNEVLAEIVGGLPGSKRFKVTLHEHCICLADETLLRGVLKNLLENGIKYSPPQSSIGIEARADIAGRRQGVRIEITNDVGDAGVPETDRLFTKYYRSKKAHRQPGSGLGLYLVSSWTELMGGTIEYASIADENGTERVSFRLWLPR